MRIPHVIRVTLLIFLLGVSHFLTAQVGTEGPIDREATRQTRALHYHLSQFSKNSNILFGHQDDLAYGVNWKAEPGRSDVKESCGSFPAVYGWELGKLGQQSMNLDSVDFSSMKGWIIEAYERGGINTISWHMDNPVSGGSAWDTTKAVHTLLPGGSQHSWLIQKLDILAAFLGDLKTGGLRKKEVPVIFRPFHEHTGSWFWWGEAHCEPEEFIALWRFTVHYLREVKGLHNLLYAYSSDIFETKEAYLRCYPGDEFVDIMGMDNYHDVSPHGDPADLTRRLRMLVEVAQAHGKISALTETGQETIPDDFWWTKTLLGHIEADEIASQISYVMVWRNAWPHHHYVPYPGHPSRRDFVLFRHHDHVWFENDLPDLYRMP